MHVNSLDSVSRTRITFTPPYEGGEVIFFAAAHINPNSLSCRILRHPSMDE